MSLERLLPLIVAVLYTITAIGCFSKREYPMAVMWFCYGIANIAVVWACWTKSL
jgi:hypothetical protein